MEPDTYVPEYDKPMPLILRLFYPEKWLFQRLRLASVDPREGGIGNAVNCGCAMYIAPVGMINAGQPRAAYDEAIDWSGAHTQSYGREAAGVLAACVAESLRPGATWQSVVACALEMAKDGTRAAIEALQEAARTLPPADVESETIEAGIARAATLRAAMLPFDTLKEPHKSYTQYGRYPSRVHSIEELPVALAYLAWAHGDFRRAALGGANYGRDSDSIASMAGAMAGALGGRGAIPVEWINTVEQVNHLDIEALSHRMADLAAEIYAVDWAQAQARQQAMGAHFCAKNGA
jgi:ADP-ribosylglycohydrolase